MAGLLVIGAVAFFLIPSQPTAPTSVQVAPPAPVIAQPTRAVINPEPVLATPDQSMDTAKALEEVPLGPLEEKSAFGIPVARARFAHDPMAYYMQLARSPAKQAAPRPTRPTVPLPTVEESPTPSWIEQWVDETGFRYVAFVNGRRPGAVVATREGEIVVFAGPFPGTPTVRIERITPQTLVLSAKGHTTEVKK